MMAGERTLQRGLLFSLLGALLFFILGFVLCEFFPDLKRTFLFKVHTLSLDLKIIELLVRFNLCAVIGFTTGLALYVFDVRLPRRGG